MALGKAVGAEALDLAKAALGEVAIVAARHHPLDHLVMQRADGADALEGRHGAAQPVGLGGGEAPRHDGDLHRLFLEQRHPERLAQHGLEFGRRIGDGLELLPPAQVGVDHVALDGAGPHDRDLDDEVVERSRAQPRQHGHLGPALDLEDPDRVGAADHVVDGRFPLPGSPASV